MLGIKINKISILCNSTFYQHNPVNVGLKLYRYFELYLNKLKSFKHFKIYLNSLYLYDFPVLYN